MMLVVETGEVLSDDERQLLRRAYVNARLRGVGWEDFEEWAEETRIQLEKTALDELSNAVSWSQTTLFFANLNLLSAMRKKLRKSRVYLKRRHIKLIMKRKKLFYNRESLMIRVVKRLYRTVVTMLQLCTDVLREGVLILAGAHGFVASSVNDVYELLHANDARLFRGLVVIDGTLDRPLMVDMILDALSRFPLERIRRA